jgi:gamma-glutamyltranspeptidase/glutathione hydrolase
MVVAMSTEPGVVSPLGGAYVTVWPEGEDPVVVDGNVAMPGKGVPAERFGQGLLEVTTSYGGGITLYAGAGSVAVPGGMAALGVAQERYGRVPWREVIAPAVAVTRDGYELGAAAASYLALTGQPLFGWDPDTNALLNRADGSARAAGDVIVDDNLSTALARIAEEGFEDLYRGELARRISDDVSRRGGLLSYEDLATYVPMVRTPLRFPLGDWDLATNPPPSIGGPVLAVMLSQLARRDGWTVDDLMEVQRLVLGYRLQVHDFSTDLETDGYALLERVERHGLVGLPTSSSTAHVSVVDERGTACAITASSGYSSGQTVPGTGLMLNNCLGEPELNRLGLHSLEPGTRLASNMAPTTARHPSGAALAIGSPGADRITTALLQVLGRFCLQGVDLQTAIARHRLHVSFSGGAPILGPDGAEASDPSHPTPVVQYERDPDIAAAVERVGLESIVHPSVSMFFGGVGAAYRHEDGSLGAAADIRRESAIGVS